MPVSRTNPIGSISYEMLSDLPEPSDVDHEDSYTLPLSTPPGTYSFAGRFIGYGTSHRDHHLAHPGEWAERPKTRTGVHDVNRCNACRWFEVRIFTYTYSDEPDALNGYLLYFVGVSAVPGENQRCRYETYRTSWEVIEALTIRRQLPDGHSSVYLPAPSASALAMAAAYDKDIQDAYIDRAVP